MLIDVDRLEREFLERTPDLSDPRQRVSFGTSGHRGTPLDGSLTAAHIAAITQAICDYRRDRGIDGPLYMGKDTHALSAPAQCDGARGPGRQRRRDDRSAWRRLHADAGHLARDPGLEPRPAAIGWRTASSSRRRTIRRKTAGSSTTRRTAVPPTPT